ncbi:helix-turn-helix transcriptional regulator [Pseudosulfitobacter koreensis]|uniref:AraC family transcriptional regulator n=1 Tax=Pseudosulfitobacter koreensis TaxID=2968472 RepID=A0ABT1Z2E2_9RHOB|nr:AraC family transcriptional regulator [Pseudosulfitobacter koreense]MCR8827300.1 AraC family transcriptional regulator [Pseudosulfitobacter koreense]
MTLGAIRINTITPTGGAQDWRWTLAHDLPYHLLLWTTRGQGRLLLNGTRRGVGAHNAIFVPAGDLFALELSRQSIGMVATIPDGTDVRLPQTPRQLRMREAGPIAELTGFLDAAGREAAAQRSLTQDALDGYMALVSVWLRRQMAEDAHLPQKMNGAARLSARFCARVAHHHANGMSASEHAEELGVTGTHLARACKAATGHTAADILSQRILHAARTALVDTDVPMQDIARHLGFGSAAYFTRYIQTQTGKTPSQLRKAGIARGH